ncbi:MAG: Protein mannosyltransferase 1 [Candidatus Giovannonibacteria bacterium GW2011_GWB1_45_9b]|uniref:Polyprenol-phosphate-mannose--protein mannosyltransferase n=4 Tax=Candidatus Giovannoniibacteriota TaxID=1752738 RepID=A0A1F5XCW2_9BACT|nr:MAG: Protein mannosyltransferase 1 [Candidatus Giovannonibacteria bacterium GW2011_GWB1_45_9b]OGF74014.1 MAG: hypothetical protein A2W57_01975 [Candidatus Giovannonibacteria bacterium RIFCSPHIGHO2_02_43_16]OGF85689.1 MAG: hypothetical protein A2Z63_00945 [Candidatus Giovannonibacteria bacterium RIFCSPLOWO2_02_44_8]OGF95576.1 MAG: hypothetical protein A2Y47_02435 [Candidatus Giovannonibacteria bacterium RIFCSPLOWO2_12_43_8]
MEKIIFSKKDYLWAAGIVLAAFLIRIPNFTYPSAPVWDEFHYTNYAIRTLNGEGAIDVHPPFMRLFFAKAAMLSGFRDTALKISISEDFKSFPYVPLRFMGVVTGSLLAGIIYLISKKVFKENSLALIPPLFAVFDGFLITYSRLILPEIYILFFGFLGILFLLSGGLLPIIIGGILIGISFSIKWSALGFLASGILYLVLFKKIKYVLPLILISCLTYFYIFSLIAPSSQFIKYQKAMYAGQLAFTEKEISYASSPIKWPFADNQFILWGNGKDDIIKLSPNLFSWALIPCSLIISLYLIYRNKDKKLIFLLAGYLASYIPFFLISRPVFLYHYIIPLVFGFLFVPFSISLLIDIFEVEKKKKIFAVTHTANALLFLIFIPFIY